MSESEEFQEVQVAPEVPRQRVRILYEKSEAIKFISHQDEFRLWERTLRRANLPLLYKQGFNPLPHIQFAAPLGVGITGAREPVDITFCPPLPLDELRQRIIDKLPPGVILHQIDEIPLKAEALMNTMIGADYTIVIYAEPGEVDAVFLEAKIATFLNQSEVWRERQRKGTYYTYNLRPLVFALEYRGYNAQSEEHTIFLRVQQRAGATGRPDEVVIALGLDDFARTLRRERMYYEQYVEDAELFAQYPVVTQQELSPAHAPRPNRKGRFVQEDAQVIKEGRGRGINERAADEFV
jgi:radical SAM-linked protein